MPKLLQIVIPHNKGEAALDVLKVLREQGFSRDTIYRQNMGQVTMLMVPIANSHLWAVSEALSEHGIGRNIGRVFVLPVDSALPLLKAPSDLGTRNIRVTNETLYETIAGGTGVSFDYVAMLIVASLIAGAGLASMLVSPLMGPILGICLGLCMVLRTRGRFSKFSGYTAPYRALIWTGIKSELLGLGVCVLCGGFIGVVFLNWGPLFDIGTEENLEMYGRTIPRNLLVGVLIAAPSGAGVALAVSTTSGGINSLVGVAISASLLPPAVNAGMLWMYGLAGPAVHKDEQLSRHDLMVDGIISLCLVLVNIAVIIVVATIFFKIRGVQPHIENFVDNMRPQKPEKDVGPIMVHTYDDEE